MAKSDSPIQGLLFAVGGENAFRAFSQDGTNWTHEAQENKGGEDVSVITFFNGSCHFICRYQYNTKSRIRETSNGVDYEVIKPPKDFKTSGAFVFQDKLYLLGGDMGRGAGNQPEMISTTNLKDWSKAVSLGYKDGEPAKTGPVLRRAAPTSEKVVVVGDFGRRSMTTNGVDWFTVERPNTKFSCADVAFGNGTWATGGLHGCRSSSTDGKNWTPPVMGEEGEHINSIVFDGRQFVGIGQGATFFSPDGIDWKRVPNREAPPIATLGNGVYVGFRWPARIFTSRDAVEWQQVAELETELTQIGFGKLG